MKNIFLCIISLIALSCSNKKKVELSEQIEFIKSNGIANLYLIKNPPYKDEILKKKIISFILSNPEYIKLSELNFYKYTTYKNTTGLEKEGTEHFIKNKPDPGGFSSEELINYPEDNLAHFFISVNHKDRSKKVGVLHYYGIKGIEKGLYEVDTIFINKSHINF